MTSVCLDQCPHPVTPEITFASLRIKILLIFKFHYPKSSDTFSNIALTVTVQSCLKQLSLLNHSVCKEEALSPCCAKLPHFFSPLFGPRLLGQPQRLSLPDKASHVEIGENKATQVSFSGCVLMESKFQWQEKTNKERKTLNALQSQAMGVLPGLCPLCKISSISFPWQGFSLLSEGSPANHQRPHFLPLFPGFPPGFLPAQPQADALHSLCAETRFKETDACFSSLQVLVSDALDAYRLPFSLTSA